MLTTLPERLSGEDAGEGPSPGHFNFALTVRNGVGEHAERRNVER